MIDTTNTKEHTEQGARKKGAPFLVEADLRDYFAAKAMQGLLSGRNHIAELNVRLAYEYADAMLKEREK